MLIEDEQSHMFCPHAVAISDRYAADGARQTGILPSAKTWARRPTGLYGKSHAAAKQRVQKKKTGECLPASQQHCP
jgi:hypothetical protein